MDKLTFCILCYMEIKRKIRLLKQHAGEGPHVARYTHQVLVYPRHLPQREMHPTAYESLAQPNNRAILLAKLQYSADTFLRRDDRREAQ